MEILQDLLPRRNRNAGTDLLLDEAIHYIQSRQRQVEETTGWTLLLTSLLLEGMSAIFDELGFALMGMVVAFLAFLLSVADLIRRVLKEGIARDGRSLLPCFYRHSGHNFRNCKPIGSLVEYFGLAGAVCQCF